MTKVFLSYSYDRDRDLMHELRSSIAAIEGVEVLDPLEFVQAGTEIAAEIRARIHACDVFVAVVGVDRPNILLETGYAEGSGKAVLLVTDAADALPFGLRSLPVVDLSGDPKADASRVARRVAELAVLQKGAESPSPPKPDQLEQYRRNPDLLHAMPPARFEELVAELFREQGFEIVRSGSAFDAGFDVLLTSPRDGRTVIVEAKKYSPQNRVSIATVRQLLGAAVLNNVDHAILVTSSSFTRGAEALASSVEHPRLVLVTVDELLRGDSISGILTREANKPIQSDRPSADR